MTDRERLDYLEKRMYVYNRSGGICEISGCNNSISFYTYQMAHIISKEKVNMRLYGKEVIHHPLNIKATCGDSCNRAASCGAHTEEIRLLVEKIRQEIKRSK